MSFKPIKKTDLEGIQGGFDLVTVIVAFVIGYALKEYTAGYWDAGNVKY